MTTTTPRTQWYLLGAFCANGTASLTLAIAFSEKSWGIFSIGITVGVLAVVLLTLAIRSR